ncbi:MAG: hypothetical protein MUF07_08685 [Steroidobacteraceae bacterium]|nr:hypothetical protein [Steroidobacteraceae bacterium]
MALTLAAAVAFPTPGVAADAPAAPPAPPSAGAGKPRSPVADVAGVDDAAAVDDELLEFLGSVGDDPEAAGDWLDFLASTDVAEVARRAAKAPARGKRE